MEVHCLMYVLFVEGLHLRLRDKLIEVPKPISISMTLTKVT